MDALPLMLDMGGAFAIRANGDLVQFDWDGRQAAEPLDDARLINVALYQGSLKHPQLACLLPSCPVDTRDCAHCHGTGRPPFSTERELGNVICYCGGLGSRERALERVAFSRRLDASWRALRFQVTIT